MKRRRVGDAGGGDVNGGDDGDVRVRSAEGEVAGAQGTREESEKLDVHVEKAVSYTHLTLPTIYSV